MMNTAKAIITESPGETIEELQQRLERAGINKDLREVSVNQLPEIQSHLRKMVSAEQLLKNCIEHSNGLIEVTYPDFLSIQDIGKILNQEARNRGLKDPVFCEGQESGWQIFEKNHSSSAVPGQTYQFMIPAESVSRDLIYSEKTFGPAAPSAVVAFAEACKKLSSKNTESLFQNEEGESFRVQCSTGEDVLGSNEYGVYLQDVSGYTVAPPYGYAVLIDSPNHPLLIAHLPGEAVTGRGAKRSKGLLDGILSAFSRENYKV